MKKTILAATLAVLVAAPAAVAAPGPSTNANTRATVKTCNNMAAQMGKRNFRALFAPKTQNARAALRNCARSEVAAQQRVRANSAQLCKTWASGEDTAGFQERFGAGTAYSTMFTGRNAHGKCTSTLARRQNAERRAAMVNAAKACAPGRTNGSHVVPALAGTSKEGQTFSAAFGTAKNAYGKCVSFVAKNRQSA
jgi:hypothetical protein